MHVSKRIIIQWSSLLVITSGFYLLSLYSFLIFHTLIELIIISIGFAIFIFFWLTQEHIENPFYLMLAIGSLFISALDLVHTLAYKGMNIFEGFDANLPTQLWITARYLQVITVLIALRLKKEEKVQVNLVVGIYLLLFIVLIVTMIIVPIFPDCFIEGSGLTPFKKVSEYFISIGFISSIYLLYRRKEDFKETVRRNLYASFGLIALAELAFTFYISVFGISNVVGHLFKLLANIFLFRALLTVGLREPYDLIFLELKQRESDLEERITQIKTLSGLLPICSSCKKIRDDQGYWHMVEAYIGDHSEAEFTHGICPDCVKKLYSDLNIDED